MKAPQRNKKPKGPLDEAIAALALACESGGDLDHEIYLSAHKSLEQMKANIMAHDQKLNQAEIAPGGDDYNQIVEMMLPSARPCSPAQDLGKIWRKAGSMEEAVALQAQYLTKGAKAIELHPDAKLQRSPVGMVITLERSRAHEILDCNVGPEEWLDLEDRYNTPAP